MSILCNKIHALHSSTRSIRSIRSTLGLIFQSHADWPHHADFIATTPWLDIELPIAIPFLLTTIKPDNRNNK